MKSLQYPGVRLQQVGDERTRAALMAFDGHVKALYEFVNSSIQTEHGPGALRSVAPVVIPEVSAAPNTRSTVGHVGELARRGPDVYMKTGRDGEDTDWTQLPTGSSGAADNTATIGLARINGVAPTFMRSDGAPPLSQAIIPLWSQVHTFQKEMALQQIAAAPAPVANTVFLYAKDKAGTSNLYLTRDDGTETEIGGGVPGIVSGSGIVDYVTRWTPDGVSLGTGVLRDDGAYVSIDNLVGGAVATLNFDATFPNTTYYVPNAPTGAANFWIDYFTGGLTAIDDPVLTWTPSMGGVGGGTGGGGRWFAGGGGYYFDATQSGTDGLVTFFPSVGGRWEFTGSGSPLVTISGTMTATSFNRMVITPPATNSTLTVDQGKTFRASASLTLTGTDLTSHQFPTTNSVIARTDAGQTFTGTQTVRVAALQDSVALAGRAGGASSFVGTLTPTTLSATRTYTLPDADGTVALTSGFPVGADPTGTGVDLAGVNGSAATFMRSDGAPKINVGIAPTWTAVHTFSSRDIHSSGINLATSGVIETNTQSGTSLVGATIQTDVSDAGTAGSTANVGLLVRNATKLTGSRPMLQVDWYSGSAYQAAFQVYAVQAAGTTKEMKLSSDSSNHYRCTVTSAGLVTQTATGTTPGMSFNSGGAASTITFTSGSGGMNFAGSAGPYTASGTSFALTASTTMTLTGTTSVTVASTSIFVSNGATIGTVTPASASGMKIAAAGDFLSFYGVAVIARPTVAIAAAAFVANTSLIANDTATFDGYTIGQVVKALRNIGILT